MSPKVAIVTGGNKGIGFATVKSLCQQFDGLVYLTARDEGRGKAAVEKLNQDGLRSVFHQLDIDSMESILRFRDHLAGTHGGIDILVNNAALYYHPETSTESFAEQAENTTRVNFKGTMNVCDNLFPLLRKHGRVVNVSSSAGHLTRINGLEPTATELRSLLCSPHLTPPQLNDMVQSFVTLAPDDQHLKVGWPNSAYVVSKVAISALTRIQQRLFDTAPELDLVVNSVHPGYVKTDATLHMGNLTPEEGCQAPVYLALLPPNVNEPRGCYIWYDKQIVDWINGPTPTVR